MSKRMRSIKKLFSSALFKPVPTAHANSLGFFDPQDSATGFLSNFYRASFLLQGYQWPTVEHFYQAHKCRDAHHQAQIRAAPSPKVAKQLGRAVGASALRPDWEHWRMTVMLQALVAKFAQNQALAQRLLATDEQTLVEASPTDAFWGCDADGQGQNRLGCLLMSLRSALRQRGEQGVALHDEPDLFRAVLSLHLPWWAFESQRAQAQQAAHGDESLSLMVRDTCLSREAFERYMPGMVFQERGFLTGSADGRAGLAAPDRIALLSTAVRSLAGFSLHAAAQPCMCPPGLWWKVMGRFTDGAHSAVQRGIVVLLQVPEAEAYLFDSLVLTDYEASLYLQVKRDLAMALAAPANPACQQPDWLEHVGGAVGFDEQARDGPVWINGMALG
jgi:N-glycosidase YbiA